MQNNRTGWVELLNVALSSPWLFPKSQALFPYLGLHNDLDALLHIMAHHSRKVMILGFNWHWQAMVQNNIFTLVRFTRTTNYIIAAGDELTLFVCIELNLPCYNATLYMIRSQGNISISQEGFYNDSYYLALVWYLLPLYLDILRKGFAIMKSDADISFAGKNIWKECESMIQKTQADLVFMAESPVNTGHFYAAPSHRVMRFFENWIQSQNSFKTLNDQQALAQLKGKIYTVCDSVASCNHAKTLSVTFSNKNKRGENETEIKMAAVYTYPSSFARFGGGCPPDTRINPCDDGVLYVHTNCMTGFRSKMNKLKQLGFWLMNDPCTEIRIDVPFRSTTTATLSLFRCVPSPRVSPSVEKPFLHCNKQIN